MEKDYEGNFEPEFRFAFEIPFGDAPACDKLKADAEKAYASAEKTKAETEDKKADAADQRIRNLERLVKLCNTTDLPVCNTLDELSMEIYK